VNLREDSYLVLNYEGGWIKLFIYTAVVLLCSHWFDLYDTARLNTKGELYFRLLLVPGLLAFMTGFHQLRASRLPVGRRFHGARALIFTIALVGWRLGMAGWCSCRCWSSGSTFSAPRTGAAPGAGLAPESRNWRRDRQLDGKTRRRGDARIGGGAPDGCGQQAESPSGDCRHARSPRHHSHAGVARLRMQGVKIEEAASWLEKISGKIEVENLNPSWLVFNDGFRRSIFLFSFAGFSRSSFRWLG
jgi:hypothetical protein